MIANRHKIIAQLPAKLEPNAEYYVRSGTGFDLYVADSTGQVAHKLNQNPNGSLMILGKNVWSVVNLPLVNEQGVATKTVINKDNEHYRITINSFATNKLSLARFDDCLSDTSVTLNKSDNYLFSFDVRANRKSMLNILYVYFGHTQTLISSRERYLSQDWQRIEFIIKPNGEKKSGTSQLFGLNLYEQDGWKINDWYEIRNLKMQKLEYATIFDIQKYEQEIQRIKQHIGLT